MNKNIYELSEKDSFVKRNYEVNYYDVANVTTFELKENRLGKKNIFGHEAYMDLTVNFNE